MDAREQQKQRDTALSILSSWGLESKQKEQLLVHQESVTAVLSIYESLLSIFEGNEDRAIEWPSRSNKAFDGKSALDLILDGHSEQVRKYLKHHVYSA